MKMNWKNLLTVVMMTGAAMSVTSCDDDDVKETEDQTLKLVNANFVDATVVPTYYGLVETTAEMIKALEAGKIAEAGQAWKESRQYWEWSEAFLFGAASGYGIDPHIDTWPFDAAAFNNNMSKYNPSENEADAANMEEIIATGQGLTGFHAVEYILFREGQVRTELTDNELWFATAAANDLYLSALKLVMAWGGELTKEQEAILEEAEFECDDFSDEFKNAGQAGSRWKTVTGASVQIIEGCQNIIDEVAHSKIGAPYTGEDTNYIESPHAYNSIQDFYDNIQSCRHALYGLTPDAGNNATPAAKSLIAYTLVKYPAETAKVQAALEASLLAINAMPKPFVLNFQDSKVGLAIKALEELDETLSELKSKLAE